MDDERRSASTASLATRPASSLRGLVREAARHATTYGLALSWVLLYGAMTIDQGRFLKGGSILRFGEIDPATAHRFGDVTVKEVAEGQVWRTVTATFIHFSLLHLACNAACLVSFGRLVESWYGRAQFLAIYVVIGGVGNGLAILGRIALRENPLTPSGGGSSVLFGLVALVAVAGWRKKTRFGDYLRREMTTKLLIFGVLIGVIGRETLDNYGHAGGALVGAAIGFLHRPMHRLSRRSVTRSFGVAGLVVLIACVIAQVRANRAEDKARAGVQARHDFAANLRIATYQYEMLAALVKVGADPRKLAPGNAAFVQLDEALARLDALVSSLPSWRDSEEYATWRALAAAGSLRMPTAAEAEQFRALSHILLQKAQDGLMRTPRGAPFGGR